MMQVKAKKNWSSKFVGGKTRLQITENYLKHFSCDESI